MTCMNKTRYLRCCLRQCLRLSLAVCAAVLCLASGVVAKPVRADVSKASLTAASKVSTSRQTTAKAASQKPKVLIALYGVLARSTRITWPQIEKMVIAPLVKDYDVEIWVLDNQLDNLDKIDGVALGASGRQVLQTTLPLRYQVIKQSHMDADLAKHYAVAQGYLPGLYARKQRQCRDVHRCQQSKQIMINAKRQLYQEQRMSDDILKQGDRFAMVVAIGADIYPLLQLDVKQLRQAMRDNPAVVLTSPQNPKGATKLGVTNGFYIGRPRAVAAAMSMLKTAKGDDFAKLDNIHYEDIVAMTMQHHGVQSTLGPLYFCKMRNTGVCAYHGRCRFGAQCHDGLTNVYQGLAAEKREAVKQEMGAIQLQWRWRFKDIRAVFETLLGMQA